MTGHSSDRNNSMCPGRRICNVLKAIRCKIAEANDIPYWTDECTLEEPCRGTCPKCDAEIRYLSEELEKKRRRGETVIIEGIGQDEIKGIERPDPYHVVPPHGMDIWPVDRYGIRRIIRETEEALQVDLDELGFSDHINNCLKNAGINTLDELLDSAFGDLLMTDDLGVKGLEEILVRFEELSLSGKESGEECPPLN